MRDLINRIEDALIDQINSDVQYNWREETVVLNLLTKLRLLLNNVTINYSSQPYKINFKLFQAFGGPEFKFGDISIIIKIFYPDGQSIEGVGFLEAKIRKKATFNFESIRVKQLRKINNNAQRALLLLIDFESIETKKYARRNQFNEYVSSTQSVVTQINSSLTFEKKDISLYRISYPFSLQLIERYFMGLDLEFDEKSKSLAQGYSIEKGYPNHTVFITLTPLKLEFDSETKINSDIYKEVK